MTLDLYVGPIRTDHHQSQTDGLRYLDDAWVGEWIQENVHVMT